MDLQHLSHNLGGFAKKNVVMLVAMAAAVITCFIVPPDAAYLDYFDLKTLTCLFCVLAVVCALKNIQFFRLFNYSEVLSPYSNYYELRFCLSSIYRECVMLT